MIHALLAAAVAAGLVLPALRGRDLLLQRREATPPPAVNADVLRLMGAVSGGT
ncbi:MAG: hypothetical protein ACLR0P_14205 [Oscillospiraceae bacterium]